MKKLLFILSVICTIGLSSCEIETSKNGDFDGFWHLVSIDTLSNSRQADLSQLTIFWAVQANLMQLRGTEQELYVRFRHEGAELTLYNPHLRDREKEDPEVGDEYMHFLYPYGINAKEEHFSVIKLNSDEMILQSATLRLHFYKM